MKVYGIRQIDGVDTLTEIFNIKEATYTGKDMGERQIVATVKHHSPINFKIGDYIDIEMPDIYNRGHFPERFYIYTLPTIKKTARAESVGDAFEHTVTFYPAQYELSTTIMRDMMQLQSNTEVSAANMLYTGYDNFTFFGGAAELMRRVQYVLDSRFGVGVWNTVVAESVDESKNTALESFQFEFSGNTVWDALAKLTDEEGINTDFFIIGRTIYVGFRRPFIEGIDENNILTGLPYNFAYGKTSHLPKTHNSGDLFTITKSIGTESPITRFYAYGADKNLNRFYCADRLRSGRYVNRLMLPSFSNDGNTDWIDSARGIEKFGIREGSKTFDDIYPSLRYMTYADLRRIKYVIKVMGNGYDDDDNLLDRKNTDTGIIYNLARAQCYRVDDAGNGLTKLTECQPPEDLAVFIHATGKTVKCTLYGGATAAEARQKQLAADSPEGGNGTFDSWYVPPTVGSCYCVHDIGYIDENGNKYNSTQRQSWFKNIDNMPIDTADERAEKQRAELHQINYTDTFWVTDVFVFEKYEFAANETPHFRRDGYSAYCYPRITKDYNADSVDTALVNEVVEVGTIDIEDTDSNRNNGRQPSFDLYLRDVGFKINEQNVFGDMQFLNSDNFVVNFYDGKLAGLDFEVARESGSEIGETVVPAYKSDGTFNDDFITGAWDKSLASKALAEGAFWRIRCKRNTDNDYAWMPNTIINAKRGDHIVFLQIQMPDIYIRAAEQRLLRAAQKYLNDNDNGDVSYNVEFDKVRMAQLPSFALQFREGVQMRIVDDDLQIYTDNEEVLLADYPNGLPSTVSMEAKQQVTNTYLQTETAADRRFWYNSPDPINGEYKSADEYTGNVCSLMRLQDDLFEIQLNEDYGVELRGMLQSEIEGSDIDFHLESNPISQIIYQPSNHETRSNARVFRVTESTITRLLVDYTQRRYSYIIEARIPELVQYATELKTQLKPISEFGHYEVDYYVQRTTIETEILTGAGLQIPIRTADPYTFMGGHWYEVVLEAQPQLTYYTEIGLEHINDIVFYLSRNLDATILYQPDCIITSEQIALDIGDIHHHIDKSALSLTPQTYRRYTIRFFLPDSFNDNADYYPTLMYVTNGKDRQGTLRLISIKQTDTDANGDIAKYTDLTIDQLTVKLSDFINEYAMGQSSDTTSSGGRVDKAVTAVVKEKQRTSMFTALSNLVKETAIVSERTEKSNEELAVIARRRYRELEALKANIFDPDGTINDVFLQVMMLQVGANSMNYALDYTRIFGGTIRNIDFVRDDEGVWSVAFGADTLRHYVYTEGIQQGTWNIAAKESVTLDNDKVYFVALKCSRNNYDGIWVVDTAQHAVDEEAGYWYFNYGIINACGDEDTHRDFTETRGNAFMYGDNIIAGKLTTLDGSSYYDLTGNSMKLGDQLLFKDGKLSIKGSAIGNIGGENLWSLAEPYNANYSMYQLYEDEIEWYDGMPINITSLLQRGKRYVFSCVNGGKEAIKVRLLYLAGNVPRIYYIEDSSQFILTDPITIESGERGIINFAYETLTMGFPINRYTDPDTGETKTVWQPTKFGQYFTYLIVEATEESSTAPDYIFTLQDCMLQEGDVPTEYQPYGRRLDYLAQAFEQDATAQDTDITGGLIATSVIKLRDNNKETAGLSGLKNDKVLFYGGGDYEHAQKVAEGNLTMPVLILKDGSGMLANGAISWNSAGELQSSGVSTKELNAAAVNAAEIVADKISTGELSAVNAKIETLVAQQLSAAQITVKARIISSSSDVAITAKDMVVVYNIQQALSDIRVTLPTSADGQWLKVYNNGLTSIILVGSFSDPNYQSGEGHTLKNGDYVEMVYSSSLSKWIIMVKN